MKHSLFAFLSLIFSFLSIAPSSQAASFSGAVTLDFDGIYNTTVGPTGLIVSNTTVTVTQSFDLLDVNTTAMTITNGTDGIDDVQVTVTATSYSPNIAMEAGLGATGNGSDFQGDNTGSITGDDPSHRGLILVEFNFLGDLEFNAGNFTSLDASSLNGSSVQYESAIIDLSAGIDFLNILNNYDTDAYDGTDAGTIHGQLYGGTSPEGASFWTKVTNPLPFQSSGGSASGVTAPGALVGSGVEDYYTTSAAANAAVTKSIKIGYFIFPARNDGFSSSSDVRGSFADFEGSITSVPEPSRTTLLLLGVFSLMIKRKRFSVRA